MGDVKLVIKIDENTYEDIKKGMIYSSVRDVSQESVLAIKNGMLLPKGHGRLIDADALIFNADYNEPLISKRDVDFAPTIIEVDKDVQDADSN